MPPKLDSDRVTPTMAMCLGLKKVSRSFLVDVITYSFWFSPINREYKEYLLVSQAFNKNSLWGEFKIKKTELNVKKAKPQKKTTRYEVVPEATRGRA
jgi:hypothetical protein